MLCVHMLCVRPAERRPLGFSPRFTTAALRSQWQALSAAVNNPTGAQQAQGGTHGMLGTLHDHAVVVVVDRLEVKSSASRRSN